MDTTSAVRRGPERPENRRTRRRNGAAPVHLGALWDYPFSLVRRLLFAFVGLVALFCVGAWVLAQWPDVPWDTLQVGAVIAMVASPFLTYPFTRTVWLAADLIFDPVKPTDR